MFNIFSRFILWLKRVLRIQSKTKYKNKEPPPKIISKKKPFEVTQTPREKSIEVPLPEKKITEVTPPSKEKPPKSVEKEARVKIVQDPSRGKKPRVEPSKKSETSLTTKETETQIKPPTEEHKANGENRHEGKDTRKSRKPYKRKAPTEERKKERRKPSVNKKRRPDIRQKKEIDLGATERRKSKSARSLQQAPLDKESQKISEKQGVIARVKSPFIEIDLDAAKVFLIIPEQQFKSDDTGTTMSRQIDYKLELNGKMQTIPVKIAVKDNQTFAKVEEKTIELEKPLKTFQVVFPGEPQDRIYSYKHSNRNLYAFVATENNRGRMHYLYDKAGNINPIPKRRVWILLEEDFELGTERDLIVEDGWVWDKYQLLLINLRKMNELTVKKVQTGEEKKISCEATFCIEGEQLVDDDFKEQTPLLVGNSIKIKAPKENPSGWIVWIQNERGDRRIIDDGWTGVQALQLRLPDDLPCECGEFQVDICNQGEGVPIETLFFRYIPSLRLVHPRELVVSDPHQGHKPESINVILGENLQNWELKTPKKKERMENGYQIELPPEDDTLHLSLFKINKPENEVRLRITIPRLRWKTSKQEKWSDKLLTIERNELVTAQDMYFFVHTNDFNTKYDFSAILESNGQKLQKAKFIQKGATYQLLLNQFYDTIKKNKGAVTLGLEIRRLEERQLLHEIVITNIAPCLRRCRSCGFGSYYPQDMMIHIEDLHLSELVEPLSYSEIRAYDSSLPHQICKCAYCGFYVKVGDPFKSSTDSIYAHFQKCPKVDRKKGSPERRWRVVSDPNEIRQNVIPNLPDFRKCRLCGFHLKAPDKKHYLEHLLENHDDELHFYE